ncbi:MAG: Glycerol-3-phosphate ABC transporter, permease protein UgpE, partial [uncultured Rubrobacteraceae bacterium]
DGGKGSRWQASTVRIADTGRARLRRAAVLALQRLPQGPAGDIHLPARVGPYEPQILQLPRGVERGAVWPFLPQHDNHHVLRGVVRGRERGADGVRTSVLTLPRQEHHLYRYARGVDDPHPRDHTPQLPHRGLARLGQHLPGDNPARGGGSLRGFPAPPALPHFAGRDPGGGASGWCYAPADPVVRDPANLKTHDRYRDPHLFGDQVERLLVAADRDQLDGDANAAHRPLVPLQPGGTEPVGDHHGGDHLRHPSRPAALLAVAEAHNLRAHLGGDQGL